MSEKAVNMLSKIEQALRQYKQLTVLQQQAIGEEDTEAITKLIAEKDLLIDTIKKQVTPELRQEVIELLREEVLAIVDIEQSNIKSLKKAQGDVRKNIKDFKNKQNAFAGYSKNMGRK